MKKSYFSLLTVCFFFFAFSLNNSHGQNVTCNDRIHVSVNHGCDIDITVDAFLEGDTQGMNDIMSGMYTYEIYNSTGIIARGDINGVTYGGQDLSAYINSILFYKIYYMGNQLTCGGTLLLEDKIDPIVQCNICPVVNGDEPSDYNPDCIRHCFEIPLLQEFYDENLVNDIIDGDIQNFIDDNVSDNCDYWSEDHVSYYDSWTNFGVCVGARLKRTWQIGYILYDGTVQTITCQREYFFQPFDLDEAVTYQQNPFTDEYEITPIKNRLVLPVAEVFVPCASGITPEIIAAHYDDPNTVDRDSDDDNIDPDELDIDLVVENNEGIPYAYPHYYADGVGSGGPHPQAINNEICNVVTGYTDTGIGACAPGCTGNRKVVRAWTILDWCTGAFISHNQIVKAVDIDAPNLQIPNIFASVDPWTCSATVALPHPEHLFDLCDGHLTYYIGNSAGYNVVGDADNGFFLQGVLPGTYSIQYKSVDCCGNEASSYAELVVDDKTPPIAVSKEFIVTSLTNISNPIDQYQGYAKVHAEDFDNGSYDSCSEVTIEVRRDDTCRDSDAIWGPYVTFCCEDLAGVVQKEIEVEIRITDASGNISHIWSTVLLEDKSADYPTVPPHMYLTCDMDYNNLEMTGGYPRIFGACGEAELVCDKATVIENTEPRELRATDGVFINGQGPIVAPAYDQSCGFGALRRQFKECGGGVQWLIIEAFDPFDDNSINWPRDIQVDCDNYEVGEPEWQTATCQLVGVSLESDTFNFEQGSCKKILNHWTLINWCTYDPTNPQSGGKYQHTQVVKIVDTNDPIITAVDSLCFEVDANCDSKDVSLSALAVDEGDCGSQWLAWELVIDLYSDWTPDYEYSYLQPKYIANGVQNPYYIAKSGNDELVTVDLPDGIPSSKLWHRAVWRVHDGCGNYTSETRYFQITDKKAPTPYCVNISTAVMSNGEVELWAIDFDQGSFDNCSDSDNLLFTFTDVIPPPRDDSEYDSNDDLVWYNGTYWYYNSEDGDYEDREDYGGEIHRWEPGLRSAGKVFTIADADADGFVEVPVYVWDECTNIDFCLVTLRLVDNGGGGMASIAGKVSTEYGASIKNVETTLEGPSNYSKVVMTDNNGGFSFIDNPAYLDYSLHASKNDDYLNGVSTLDMIYIQRHILGQSPITNPYQLIAADVTNDTQVSALDLVEIRKLILGISSKFTSVGSWKFIDQSTPLNMTNLWSHKEQIDLYQIATDANGIDFMGLKMGDVDGSVDLDQSKNRDLSKLEKSPLYFENKVYEKGEAFDLVLELSDEVFAGYQYQIAFDNLKIKDIQINDRKNVTYYLADNMLKLISTSTLKEAGSVKLTVVAKADGVLNESMQLMSAHLMPEAYNGNLQVRRLELTEKIESEILPISKTSIALSPNPFSNETTLEVSLEKAQNVSYEIFDLAGKSIYSYSNGLDKGMHQMRIDREILNGAGLYILKFTTENYTTSETLVLVD